MSGAVSYHAGLAAEGAVAAHYVRRGLAIAARRWRGRAGEIDLIAREGAAVVLVEVKCARDFARAADRLSRRQLERIFAAGAEFLAGEPAGQATPVRVDLAMVDRQGQVRILENLMLD